MSEHNPANESETFSETREDITEPPMYRVLLINDNYTTMDFVVMILEQIFHKKQEDAVQIMLSVHQTGIGVCGVYTFDIAETKTQSSVI